jgi:hypothetical protein
MSRWASRLCLLCSVIVPCDIIYRSRADLNQCVLRAFVTVRSISSSKP